MMPNIHSCALHSFGAVAAIILACTAVSAAAPAGQAKEALPSKPGTKAAPKTQILDYSALAAAVPKSVFVIPSDAREGRNPFFPQPIQTSKAAPKPAQNGVNPNGIVVNGITSPPKATVMLNGTTFEPGETGNIRMRDGTRVRVQCLEINADSVIILIDGQRRELKLRPGL